MYIFSPVLELYDGAGVVTADHLDDVAKPVPVQTTGVGDHQLVHTVLLHLDSSNNRVTMATYSDAYS